MESAGVVTVPCASGDRRWVVCFRLEPVRPQPGSTALRARVTFANGARVLTLGAVSTADVVLARAPAARVFARGVWNLPHEIPGRRELLTSAEGVRAAHRRHSGALLDARSYTSMLTYVDRAPCATRPGTPVLSRAHR